KLLDTPKTGYDDSKALIKKWHNRGRLLYAITPRCAPTSTHEQLEATDALCKEHPGCYMQTHVSENKGEVAWVKELFPERKGLSDRTLPDFQLFPWQRLLQHPARHAEGAP